MVGIPIDCSYFFEEAKKTIRMSQPFAPRNYDESDKYYLSYGGGWYNYDRFRQVKTKDNKSLDSQSRGRTLATKCATSSIENSCLASRSGRPL